MIFLFNQVIFRFHVNFQECITYASSRPLDQKVVKMGVDFFYITISNSSHILKTSKTSLAWSNFGVWGCVFSACHGFSGSTVDVMAFHHGAVQHLLQFIECHSATAVFVKDLEGRPAHTCCQVYAQK